MEEENKKPVLGEQNITDSNEELGHEIEELTHEFQKQNSAGRIFWNGIISGLGRAVGATIIFAVIIALLSYVVKASDAQWIDTLISWLGLSVYLN